MPYQTYYNMADYWLYIYSVGVCFINISVGLKCK